MVGLGLISPRVHVHRPGGPAECGERSALCQLCHFAAQSCAQSPHSPLPRLAEVFAFEAKTASSGCSNPCRNTRTWCDCAAIAVSDSLGCQCLKVFRALCHKGTSHAAGGRRTGTSSSRPAPTSSQVALVHRVCRIDGERTQLPNPLPGALVALRQMFHSTFSSTP